MIYIKIENNTQGRVGVKEACLFEQSSSRQMDLGFARAKEELWKKVLEEKYGQEDLKSFKETFCGEEPMGGIRLT